MNIVDLHIHTEFSDGQMKISELESFVIENGIKCFAITDHDTVEGYNHFINSIDAMHNFRVYSGIEVTVQHKNKSLHLLGYDMDVNNEEFMKLINKIKMSFCTQVISIIQLLKKEGYNLGPEIKWLKKGIDTLAIFCVEKGYFSDKYAFYKHVFYNGKDRINIRRKPLAHDAINSILKAGGFVSLAHPTRISNDINEVEHVIKDLKAYGLTALECFHPMQKDNYQIYIELAFKYNLYITGGSDFHKESSFFYKQNKSLIPYNNKTYKWNNSNYYIYL